MKFAAKFSIYFLLVGIFLAPTSCSRIIIIDPVSSGSNTKIIGKPVFSDDLYYFSKEALKNIKSYDKNILILTDLNGVISANETVNSGGRLAAHEISVGDYLVSETTPSAPQGFFGKVKSIVKNGAEYLVETIDATFEDVFKDVNVKHEYTLPINFTIPEKTKISLKTSIGAETDVILEGSVNYYITLGYEIRSENYEIEKASLALSTKSDHKIKITAELGGNIEANIDKFPLLGFSRTTVFFIGPVPIVVSIAGSLYGKVSMNGKVSIDVEFNKKSTSVIGGTYEKGKDWQEIGNLDKDESSIKPIAVDLEGGAKAGIYAGITIKFYGGVAAIFGDIGAYGKLKGDCVNLKGNTIATIGAEITGGIAVAMFSKIPSTLSLTFEGLIGESPLGTIISNYSCSGIPLTSTPTEIYQGGKSIGDPNIVTFDGKPYSFNGVGEFVAVKSTIDNFEIQVRQEELKLLNGSGSVSWSTGLAINTGGDRLCFYPDKYYINGTQFAYSSSINHSLQNGSSITGNISALLVNTNGRDVIKIFNRIGNQGSAIDYSIIPNTQRQGKMIGIFGNYDNSLTNDLQIRNGTTIDGSYSSLYPTFTDSWRIDQGQSLFVYDAGKNTATYTDKTFPRSALVISSTQRANAEQVCKNAGVVAPFLEGCINDVVATGDNSFATRPKDVRDEKVIRSFTIDFASVDRSLYDWSQSVTFKDNYALLEGAFGASKLVTKNVVSINTGFEATLYVSASKEPILNSVILSLGEGGVLGALFFRITNSPIDFFDEKIHKINLIFSPVGGSSINDYKVSISIDNQVVLNQTETHENLPPLGKFMLTNEGKAKIYNWSFKNY